MNNVPISTNLDSTAIKKSNSNSKYNSVNRRLTNVISEDITYINDIIYKLKEIFSEWKYSGKSYSH